MTTLGSKFMSFSSLNSPQENWIKSTSRKSSVDIIYASLKSSLILHSRSLSSVTCQPTSLGSFSFSPSSASSWGATKSVRYSLSLLLVLVNLLSFLLLFCFSLIKSLRFAGNLIILLKVAVTRPLLSTFLILISAGSLLGSSACSSAFLFVNSLYLSASYIVSQIPFCSLARKGM